MLLSEENDIDNAVCRVVAFSDGKIPASKSVMPSSLLESPHYVLKKLDYIFHAKAHAESIQRKRRSKRINNNNESDDALNDNDVIGVFDNDKEEQEVIHLIRKSLQDAGFELLTQRDLDLCEALNAGYLLRLSILPNVKRLDPEIGQLFYPNDYTDLLFDGRVLAFRRGYSSQVTTGRLLLPKLDYLQAGLVQQAASAVTKPLGRIERALLAKLTSLLERLDSAVQSFMADMIALVPSRRAGNALKNRIQNSTFTNTTTFETPNKNGDNVVFKLSRYGGSKMKFVGSPNPSDALTPFIICEVDGQNNMTDQVVNHDMYTTLNEGSLTCQYDARQERRPNVQLLKRISISNVVDLFSAKGRGQLVEKLFSKSKLVEPTYEEVVLVWRNLAKPPRRNVTPPKFVYDAAEIFGVEDRLPKRQTPIEPDKPGIQIRTFSDVPMANLPAIFPRTKLVFRPADAFVFDFISLASLAAVLGSVRFDNPKLDILAIASVSIWIIRTLIRYSNKLARYDLLVKTFLTSKITHRGSGALTYLALEAGSQKASRAALLYAWLSSLNVAQIPTSRILQEGKAGSNQMLQCDRRIELNVEAALQDLHQVGLISYNGDGKTVEVLNSKSVSTILKTAWMNIIESVATEPPKINRPE